MSLRDFFLKRHGINEVYMQVLTIEDNVLKQILQVFENITHYAKEDIFALTVMVSTMQRLIMGTGGYIPDL